MTKANRRTNVFPLGKSSPRKKNFQYERSTRKPISHLCIDFSGSTSILFSASIVANLLTHQRRESQNKQSRRLIYFYRLTLNSPPSLSSAKALAVAQSLRRAFSSVRTSLVITTSLFRWKFLFKCSETVLC